MIYLYSMFDKKSESYTAPIIASATTEVMYNMTRAFLRDYKQDEVPMFVLFPEDYEVYKIGDFDADTGCIAPGKTKVFSLEECSALAQRMIKNNKENLVNDESKD